MKEYKTVRVAPDEENDAIRCYESFGWKLEETREIYNESQEVVGESYTSYNSFMQGFTGKDGRVDVQTRTNVTHFLSMRFSRDTSMKYYYKLSTLQKEFENLEFEPYYEMPKKPILTTVLGIVGIITGILPLLAIVNWINYASDKKKAIALNKVADEKNPQIKKRIK